MAAYADALIAFWDGESKGTKNMIALAEQAGLIVKVFYFKSIEFPDACVGCSVKIFIFVI
jgi:hypothetical protein